MGADGRGAGGRSGGSEDKRVGTVWMGVAVKRDDKVEVTAKLHSFGDIGRNKVRDVTCYEALRALSAALTNHA